MNKVSLPPNIPQLLALQDPEGQYNPDINEVSYLTTDGRMLVLNSPVATRLNMLALQSGETAAPPPPKRRRSAKVHEIRPDPPPQIDIDFNARRGTGWERADG